MIRMGLISLLIFVVCGCSNRSKLAGECADVITYAQMLCHQIFVDRIEMGQLDMEVLQSDCNRWRVFYRVFRRDGCVVSVWELNGHAIGIRIEPFLLSGQLMRYVFKVQDGRFLYMKPECAIEVINPQAKSNSLEEVLEVQKSGDAFSFSREKFGCPNAMLGKHPVYYFNILNRDNLSATLTLFSGFSWLIELSPQTN